MSSTIPSNPTTRLPPELYYHLVHTLCRTLPSPLTDSAEDLVRRNRFAITLIDDLAPATMLEADLAAHYVAASEHWKDSLRLAEQPDMPPQSVQKCRAQASGMMRQALSAHDRLLCLQGARLDHRAIGEARGTIRRDLAALTAEPPPSPPADPPPTPAAAHGHPPDPRRTAAPPTPTLDRRMLAATARSSAGSDPRQRPIAALVPNPVTLRPG